MSEVNTERVALWIQALRSGEYVQGLYKLETTDDTGAKKHCCLGVAIRVAMANGCEGITEIERDVDGRDYVKHTSFITEGTPTEGVSSELPPEVMNWYGLPDPYHGNPAVSPVVVSEYGTQSQFHAIGANDNQQWTFDMIADGLERAWLVG